MLATTYAVDRFAHLCESIKNIYLAHSSNDLELLTDSYGLHGTPTSLCEGRD